MIWFVLSLAAAAAMVIFLGKAREKDCFINEEQLMKFHGEEEIVDVRDYTDSYQSPLDFPNQNIPVAYLKRYYEEIHSAEVFLVASTVREAKAAKRLFKNKAIHVKGIYLYS